VNPTTLVAILAVSVPVGFGLLGFFAGRLQERRRFSSGTVLIGIDPKRLDIEIRSVRPKNNEIVWGTEKTGSLVTKGVVNPGLGAPMTINGSGRALLVNRETLGTMRVSEGGGEIEPCPEDGWARGMHSAGIHERNVARPTGGSWLDTLAQYTPILVIGVGIVLIVGIIALSGKFHG
jgi:hypothetical protein